MVDTRLVAGALLFGVASTAFNYGRNVETPGGVALWAVVSVVGSYAVFRLLSALSGEVGLGGA
ncbi:hypothetical protein [Halobaculum sp. MBLA0143]|uniref:hypothetical protein n=1 Tax=Halobaculum sp. MBLA0143 TaxID=3079933 RepID=UPI003523FCF0